MRETIQLNKNQLNLSYIIVGLRQAYVKSLFKSLNKQVWADSF